MSQGRKNEKAEHNPEKLGAVRIPPVSSGSVTHVLLLGPENSGSSSALEAGPKKEDGDASSSCPSRAEYNVMKRKNKGLWNK